MLILSSAPGNIKKARRIIKNGGVVIYPTDTLYGLGVDIFNRRAVEKIFVIKGRDPKKPISIMVSELKDIKKLVVLSPEQEKIVRGLLPGPFTLILKKRKGHSTLLDDRPKVGIRMADSKICQMLAKNLPLTATSANLSGQKPTLNIKKLAKIFANSVDLILVGRKMSGRASTVIDLTEKPFKVLR